ncbi:Na(+)/H(+) antiporter subunit D [bacterium]|nr:Na(+)/H(+) antiporter subunit D [bacterium]
MIFDLYPGLPLLVGLVLMPLFGVTGRRIVSLLAPAASLVCFAAASPDAGWSFQMAQHEWVIWHSDALARVFALAFALYALIAGIYAWTETARGPKTASMALAAGGVGIAFAGDLLTLYFFWELLTIGSMFAIWYGGTREAIRAGFHYVMVHLFGGMCLLTGILLHLAHGGEGLQAVSLDTAAGWLILLGFVINAAVPPLHAWLSDAYPRASIYGTVFLAAFTTKSAVYALARFFPGADILVWAGAIMALYGVVYAVLENNIRRLLAYHIISQVGYMVCGVGLGTALAINGASAHAFSHIFYKGLLLMSAGAVIYSTGRGQLTELGGLARPLKWTLFFCMIGAFSISGVPLFNGFISKSMIISAASESHRGVAELMLLIASMGTFLHTGLKLPWFTFFGKDQGARVLRPVPRSMMLAMSLSAVVCVGNGVIPGLLYRMLPNPVDYHPYTTAHVIQSLELLIGTALGFWILRSKLGGQATVTLDTDRLYRGPSSWVVLNSGRVLHWAGLQANRTVSGLLSGSWHVINAVYNRVQTDALSSLIVAIWVMLSIVALLLFRR